MALIEVKVPQFSESVSEGTLLEWKKKPGDAVEADEVLVEIETDKVVLEVPAPSSGVMSGIVRADGSTVASEEVIATIDTDASAQPAPAAAPCKHSHWPARHDLCGDFARAAEGNRAVQKAHGLAVQLGLLVQHGFQL